MKAAKVVYVKRQAGERRRVSPVFSTVLSLLIFAFASPPIPVNAVTPTPQPVWPMFHYDARHTGKATTYGPSIPILKWSYRTGGSLFSSPVVDAGSTVYLGEYMNWTYTGMGSNAYGFDSAGLMLWSYTAADGMSSSAATIGNRIFIGSYDNRLYSINTAGVLLWSYETGSSIDENSSPVVDMTRLWIGSDDCRLYCIGHDGQLSWSYDTGSLTTTSPALSDTNVYIGSFNDSLYCITLDGQLVWSYVTGDSLNAGPALTVSDTVYAGSWDNNIYSIDSVGALLWSYELAVMSWSDMTAAIGTDAIYIGSGDNNFYCLKQYGQLVWSYETDGGISSSPALDATECVYVGSDDSQLYSIYPYGGLQWSFDTGFTTCSSPAIGTDTIYVGSHSDVLYVLVQPTPTPTPMPTPTPRPTFPQGLIVTLNKYTFAPGDTLEIYVSFTDTAADWDGYLVFFAENGRAWSAVRGGLKRGIHPLVRNVLEIHYPWGPRKVFSMRVPDGAAGGYRLYGATLPTGLKPTLANARKPCSQLDIVEFTVVK